MYLYRVTTNSSFSGDEELFFKANNVTEVEYQLKNNYNSRLRIMEIKEICNVNQILNR